MVGHPPTEHRVVMASGLLHGAFVADDFTWHLSWSMLALLPVAMFLDAGALLEENGWRGFALPVLLRTHGPVAASLIVGLAWASWHFPVKFDAFLDDDVWGALPYLGAFTIKIVAISVAITFFWARAGQATLLAVAMHGLSNDVGRVGGLVDGTTWQSSAMSELDLAVPFIVLGLVLVPYANRTGWGDLSTSPAKGPRTSGVHLGPLRCPATSRRDGPPARGSGADQTTARRPHGLQVRDLQRDQRRVPLPPRVG